MHTNEEVIMKTQRIFSLALALLLAFPAVSCSDDAGSQQPDDPTIDDNDGGNDGGNDDDQKNDGEIVEPERPDDGWSFLLIPNMATDVEIASKGTGKLSVMAVSTDGDNAGEGVVGQSVSWGVETKQSSLSLGSSATSTKEGGIASVNIRGLGVAGNATVIASSKIAPKTVSFNVRVLDLPIGNLRVNASYNGLANVENYSVHLYDYRDLHCGMYDPRTGTDADEYLPHVDAQTADFIGLSPDNMYTVVVSGFSPDGAKVASGCVDYGTDVFENQTTNVNVYLDTIDLSLNTTYRARSYFDLGDVANALGTVGQFVNAIAKFADNPAKELYDLLFTLIKEYVGGAGTLLEKVLKWTNLETELVNYLNSLLTQNKTVCQVGNFACQIRSIIRTMEFMGDLEIERVGQVELRGHNAYDGMAVYWRGGCKTDGNGDYADPSCGRYPLSTKQLNLSQDIYFLEGSWSGSLANGYDKISIESHALSLEYGKIAVFLINNVVLPKLAGGAKNFPDAIAYWINCTAVGEWLADKLTISWLGINVSKAQATGWCKSAASAVGSGLGFLAAMGELQKANSNVEISGTAYVDDTNADNAVDDIVDGKWSGSMTISTTDADGNAVTTTTGVRGIWSAYNAENVKIGEGEDDIYCTTPKSEKDSDDQVCGYPAVDINSLVSSNMCKKFIECSK